MNAISCRKYRQSLKDPANEEKLNEAKEKKKELNKAYMEMVLSDPVTAKIYREKKAADMRKCRENKLSQLKTAEIPLLDITNVATCSQLSAFTSKYAKSKAVSKAEKSLPKNAEKRKEVIEELVHRSDMEIPCAVIEPPMKKPRCGFHDTEKLVVEFYESDTISRVNPGKRDFRKIVNADGVKEVVQTRSLMMTIEEAFKEFQVIHPGLIGSSKFYSLRPQHILRYDEVKNETCLCTRCENFQLLCSALSPFMSLKLKSSEYLDKFCCDIRAYSCASNSCDKCSNFKPAMENLLTSCSLDEVVKNYYQWDKDKKTSFYQKIEIQGKLLSELLDKFSVDFIAYKFHKFIAKTQTLFLANLKMKLANDEGVIVCDFSERYSTESRRATQSSFFGQNQVSLFTASLQIGDKIYNFIIASDVHVQSKEMVYAYIKKIIEKAKIISPSLRHVKIFSDGCAQQFKNKYTFLNLLYASNDFGVELEWHFFATSHGKSCCDGLGGSVKRNVRNRVVAGDEKVYCAAQFVSCASKFANKFEIFEMTKKEITDSGKHLNSRWSKAKVIPGTQSFHLFRPSVTPGFILASTTSQEEDISEFKLI